MSRLACDITRQKRAISHSLALIRNDRRSYMTILSDQRCIHINRVTGKLLISKINYNPRKKSLARLDQIAQKCVDKPFLRQTGIGNPLPPPNNVGSEQ